MIDDDSIRAAKKYWTRGRRFRLAEEGSLVFEVVRHGGVRVFFHAPSDEDRRSLPWSVFVKALADGKLVETR